MLLQQIVTYILSSFAQQFLGIFTSFSTRKFIPPAEFGVWVTITLLLKYCQYSNLGVFSAIYKEIPFYIGKKDFKTAADIKNLSGTFIFIMSGFVAVVIFAASLFLRMPPQLRGALQVAGVMIFLTLIFNFFITLFRAYNDFMSLSKIVFMNSVFITVLYIALSYWWQLAGLYVAAVLSLLCSILYIFMTKREVVTFQFVFSFQKIKGVLFLLKTGIGLLFVGLFYTVFLTTDKWIIMRYFGLQHLGYYSIALIFFEGISQIPLLISHVIFPEMQTIYGARGSDANVGTYVKKYLSELTLNLSYVLPLCIGFVYLWGHWMIARFIPKYAPGVASMNILLIGAFFLGLSQFSNHFLITLNKYLLSIPLTVISSLAVLIASYVLIHAQYGLESVAMAATFGYFLFFLLVSLVSLKSIYTFREIILMHAKILAVAVYYLFLLFLCRAIKLQDLFNTAIVQSLIFFAGASPLMYRFNRKTEFLRKIFKKIAPRSNADSLETFDDPETIL